MDFPEMSTASARVKTTLYIGGLTPEVTTDVLYAAFAPFGEVVECTVPGQTEKRSVEGHATNSAKGYGFVQYAEEMDAEAAVDNMHLSELFGRTIRVSLAKPTQRMESGGFAKHAVWNTAGHEGYGGMDSTDEKSQAVEVRVAGEPTKTEASQEEKKPMTALDQLRSAQKESS
ncbi:hypothetical protein BJ684DRAFT_21364 [Piptocephalis cylindrospora]|uniref:RRM domain-containing protein n=1 Tax=Piptocephalis cylindrospora TaxID=1907219 RepID=A0A4P9Y2J6_9FUNG|nr:hypothetical protein BJ684DRAFT_21364 [Piptocephalis cylindrospora]|eukprot:RKP12070.1 hypothetical protein BJ684DRAFT_21364 [Piptocephalis cylindrospora]